MGDAAVVQFTSSIEVSLVDVMGDDRRICDCARVSTLGEEAAAASDDRDAGLIRYLMRSKHGSPFEHGALTFLVSAPIFVFWDHVRHRVGVSYNIESSRYRELRPCFYRAERSRTQSGKPGHYVMAPGSPGQDVVMAEANLQACISSWSAYREQLAAGIAREQAMQVLPMSTMISAYVSFNPRSLMKFLELRLGPAREEMQRLALAYGRSFSEHWPMTHAAFEEFGRVAP